MVMFLVLFGPPPRVGSNHRNNKRLHRYCVDFSGLAVVGPEKAPTNGPVLGVS